MGNRQVHVAAQRVDVRLERLGRAAAVLRLDDPAPVQEGADGRNHARDRGKPFERLPVEDQVQVTLAQHQLPVLQPRPLVGQRPDGLGKQPHLLHQYRDLAALGLHHLAGGLDHVPHVEQVEIRVAERPVRRAGGLDELPPQEQLDAAGLVLDVPEGQRALLAPGHQAARNRHLLAVVPGEVVEDDLGVVGAAAARRVRVEPQVAQRGGFAQPDIPDLG